LRLVVLLGLAHWGWLHIGCPRTAPMDAIAQLTVCRWTRFSSLLAHSISESRSNRCSAPNGGCRRSKSIRPAALRGRAPASSRRRDKLLSGRRRPSDRSGRTSARASRVRGVRACSRPRARPSRPTRHPLCVTGADLVSAVFLAPPQPTRFA